MFKLPLRSNLHIFYGAEIITLQYCLNIHLALIYACLIELCHSATWCHQLYILCKLPLRGYLHIFYGAEIITLQYCLNIHLALIYSCLIELCHSATWCHHLYILCKLPLRGHLHIFYGGNGVQSSLLGLNGAIWDISSSGASNPRPKEPFSRKKAQSIEETQNRVNFGARCSRYM